MTIGRSLCLVLAATAILVAADGTPVEAKDDEPFKVKALQQKDLATPLRRRNKLNTRDFKTIVAVPGVEVTLPDVDSVFHGYNRSKNKACTVTAIGPTVLLTAAHCVGNGGSIAIELVPGSWYNGKCEHHPRFADNTDRSADIAICKLAPGVELPRIRFERITFIPDLIQTRYLVVLGGFGCTTRDATGDGKYHMGYAKVARIPGKVTNVPDLGAAPSYFTIEPGETGRDAILCPGDSGGAVFCLSNPYDTRSQRWICGVNSKVECLNELADGTCVQIGTTSYLTSISTAESMKWLLTIAGVCGINDFVHERCRASIVRNQMRLVSPRPPRTCAPNALSCPPPNISLGEGFIRELGRAFNPSQPVLRRPGG